MSQILYLDTTSNDSTYNDNAKLYELSLISTDVRSFRQLTALLEYISVIGASELDLNYPTIVIINENVLSSTASSSKEIPQGASTSPLNTLSYEDQKLLLTHHYKHLNILTFKLSEFSITKVNQEIEAYHSTLKNRILRMKSWVGLNNHHAKRCPCLHSMTNCLNVILQNDYQQSTKLRKFILLINVEIDFKKLLTLPKQNEFYLYCIGNWGFIAHELTCDELTFCALQIFKSAFAILDQNNPLILDDNSILSFLFSLRDSYRGGNAFHNFRHAVDVLQATFYFLIRINALPKFKEYTTNLNIHPSEQLRQNLGFSKPFEFDKETALLNPIQTLALLVSSIGHDVGHPGVTNPFLITNKSPIAKIYSNQSVLENYHSTIFQDILTNHWPIFLNNEHTKFPQSPLNTKVLQVESIIATDMANHFEYILKVEEISSILSNPEKRLQIKNHLKQTNIILSLLIKCADISNVSRPLEISSKWGIVLAREFDQIAKLDLNINNGEDIESIIDDRKGPYFPKTAIDCLKENPALAKGQLFFINTFADSLFKEVATVLPELKFSTQIVLENKAYWTSVEANQQGNK